jgi:hypothetical protein
MVHPVGSYCTEFPGNVSENIVQCSKVEVQMDRENDRLLLMTQSAVLLYDSDFKSESP